MVGLALAMFLAGGLGLWRVVRPSSGPSPPSTGAARSIDVAPIVGATSLQQVIVGLQARLRALPQDWASWAQLGQAYVQEARVSADPTYYPKAEGALHRSLSLNRGSNFDAMTGMAALAAARHDFTGALSWGERARAVNPDDPDVYAVIGDAEIELGRYPEAFETFQKGLDLKPNLSLYARASYAWELQGDVPNAIRAMNLALRAAGSSADSSWCLNQLGELYWGSGDLNRAEGYYSQAMAEDPKFVPPRAGLAKVEAARGQYAKAIAGYRSVVAIYPLPAYVIALSDLYRVTGQRELAEREAGLVGVEEKLFQANGVNVDLEIALFDADHHVNLAEGLAAAQSEWGRRHSVHVADALAWALYANGRPAEALPYADQALHLGYRNALFFFHRAMIEKDLSRTGPARRDLAEALRINPYFSSLWSRTAATSLRSLGGRP